MAREKKWKHYKDWLGSDDARRHVIENVKKSGVPLELRAKKIFKDHGFWMGEAHYLDLNINDPDMNSSINFLTGHGTWRELDISATYDQRPSISIQGCEMRFVTRILAECKYSFDKEILALGYSEYENFDIGHFPMKINGQSLNTKPLWTGVNLPLIAARLIEFDSNNSSRTDDNFTDHGVHKASEQILSALKFFLYQWRLPLRSHYISIGKSSSIMGKWEELYKEHKLPYEQFGNQKRVPDSFIDQFLKENFNPLQMKQDFPMIRLFFCFPIIITDEGRGIIKAKLDNSYNITELEDEGMCLYTYISEKSAPFETDSGGTFTLPILVCNLTNLPRAISLMGEVIENSIEKISNSVTENPYLIAKEIIFNDNVVTL